MEQISFETLYKDVDYLNTLVTNDSKVSTTKACAREYVSKR